MHRMAIVLLATVVASPAFASKPGQVEARQSKEIGLKQVWAQRRQVWAQRRTDRMERINILLLQGMEDHLVDDLLKLALIRPDLRLLQAVGIKIVGPNTAGPGRVAFPEREIDLKLIRIRFVR
jgi:hypothetical protein